MFEFKVHKVKIKNSEICIEDNINLSELSQNFKNSLVEFEDAIIKRLKEVKPFRYCLGSLKKPQKNILNKEGKGFHYFMLTHHIEFCMGKIINIFFEFKPKNENIVFLFEGEFGEGLMKAKSLLIIL